MEEKPKNPFVHPVRHTVIKDNIIQTASDPVQGMTLLDYFAGQVFQANIDEMTRQIVRLSAKSSKENYAQYFAKYAYDSAEAMLRERERRGL